MVMGDISGSMRPRDLGAALRSMPTAAPQRYAHLSGCSGLWPGCPVGSQPSFEGAVWHGHVPALVSARHKNKAAGEKVVKIVIRDHHFHIVPSKEA